MGTENRGTATLDTARRGRSLPLAGLIVTGLLLTTSCATVDTELTVGADGKGSRTFEVTIPQDNVEQLKGGKEAAEKSIEKHLPEGLEFTGTSTNAEGLAAEFTLEFDSTEQYEEKVMGLLEAADLAVNQEATLSVTDDALVSGIQLRETASSDDMFRWMVEGLVEDGVLTEDVAQRAWANQGDAVVVFEGEKKESGRALSLNDVTDHGFQQVVATVTPGEGDSYAVQVDFGTTQPISGPRQKAVDEYFAGATPEGATLIEDPGNTSTDRGRSLRGEVTGVDGVQGFLRTALGSEATEFAVETRPSESTLAAVETVITGTLDCASVCSPTSQTRPQLRWVLPEGWDAGGAQSSWAGENGERVIQTSEEDFRLVTERKINVQDIHASVEVAGADDVTVKIDYVVPSAEDAPATLKPLVAPNGDAEAVTERTDGGSTVLTTEMTGTAEEVNAKLAEYGQGGAPHLFVTEGEGSLFQNRSDVTAALDTSGLPLAERVTGDIDMTLSGKNGASIDEETVTGGVLEDGKVKVTAQQDGQPATTGRTAGAVVTSVAWSGVILLGVIGLLVLGLIAAAILFRKRLSGVWAKRTAVTSGLASAGAAAAASARNAASTAGSHAATTTRAAQPAEDPVPEAFREDDLR